ncbi:hypothetical protein [Hymenobacter persicinus]|uniref:Cytochrome c domain-containing protein n=1 Tax=Hymenobacter persicinus TaxID=2025506 RepID=A0A4Q5LFM2_9BACT|nr:hypothetical protein [Hymenobacter persicinus]RYU84247.1 hypothetical protein EWM57_00715 [Hymenobacter persicinus]
MLRRAHLFLLFPALSLGSCTYDNAEDLLARQPVPCDLTAITYTGSISPLLDRNCRSCHNASLLNGNVNLEGYAQAKRYADNGLLVGVTSHAAGFKPMPQNAPKLPECDVNRIRQWVAAGAPNN